MTRAIDSAEVAILVRAIRDRVALNVLYQSMDEPGQLQRTAICREASVLS